MYKRKDSIIGLGRICRIPTRPLLPNPINSAISRTMELALGAIRQNIQERADAAGSNSSSECPLDLRKPQKWAVWTLVDTRTAARHRVTRQVAHLACRHWIFTESKLLDALIFTT